MFVALEKAYRSCWHSFMALTRASDTSVADGLYQTPVKNFLVVKIPIKHSSLYNKNGPFFFCFNKCACVNAINFVPVCAGKYRKEQTKTSTLALNLPIMVLFRVHAQL